MPTESNDFEKALQSSFLGSSMLSDSTLLGSADAPSTPAQTALNSVAQAMQYPDTLDDEPSDQLELMAGAEDSDDEQDDMGAGFSQFSIFSDARVVRNQETGQAELQPFNMPDDSRVDVDLQPAPGWNESRGKRRRHGDAMPEDPTGDAASRMSDIRRSAEKQAKEITDILKQ
ncbi:hypothetical protein EC988_009517, partial [Linderina pennispora]